MLRWIFAVIFASRHLVTNQKTTLGVLVQRGSNPLQKGGQGNVLERLLRIVLLRLGLSHVPPDNEVVEDDHEDDASLVADGGVPRVVARQRSRRTWRSRCSATYRTLPSTSRTGTWPNGISAKCKYLSYEDLVGVWFVTLETMNDKR